jgi:hypothetical protein
MTTPAAAKPAEQPKSSTNKSAAPPGGKIHPVVIYPFQQPGDYADLEPLYQLVARLGADTKKYARPITVLDRKTHFANDANKRFLDFRQNTVARHSKILDAWCVDTCQMWYSGLGQAFEEGGEEDVYWLIPGDFNYGSPVGLEILCRLHLLPEICLEQKHDLCIGEIATNHGHSKQLIDTYGTFALLYNWFPAEAQEIRQYTQRPRSEFFALRHRFLREALLRRWYAYEQTVVMLLQAVTFRQRISQFFVGDISDLPEGRESLASALQQVERTERVLKSLWCERSHANPGWLEQYRVLENQSEQVRRTALILLKNLLP